MLPLTANYPIEQHSDIHIASLFMASQIIYECSQLMLSDCWHLAVEMRCQRNLHCDLWVHKSSFSFFFPPPWRARVCVCDSKGFAFIIINALTLRKTEKRARVWEGNRARNIMDNFILSSSWIMQFLSNEQFSLVYFALENRRSSCACVCVCGAGKPFSAFTNDAVVWLMTRAKMMTHINTKQKLKRFGRNFWWQSTKNRAPKEERRRKNDDNNK